MSVHEAFPVKARDNVLNERIRDVVVSLCVDFFFVCVFLLLFGERERETEREINRQQW